MGTNAHLIVADTHQENMVNDGVENNPTMVFSSAKSKK
jgi:hypothetical protein